MVLFNQNNKMGVDAWFNVSFVVHVGHVGEYIYHIMNKYERLGGDTLKKDFYDKLYDGEYVDEDYILRDDLEYSEIMECFDSNDEDDIDFIISQLKKKIKSKFPDFKEKFKYIDGSFYIVVCELGGNSSKVGCEDKSIGPVPKESCVELISNVLKEIHPDNKYHKELYVGYGIS